MVAAAAMPVSAMAVPTVLEAPEQQTVEILADGSARVDGASFGIIGFERLAKGAARASEGAPEGYRLPISDSAGLVVVRAPDEVLLHVDREVAATFDLEDPSGAGLSALWSMVCALDEAGSMGGALLSEGEVPLRLVTDSECVSGVFRYRFDARGDDGARYVTVTLANAEEGEAGLDTARAAGVDLGDGVLWCDFAQVVDAGNMVAKDDPGVVGEALAFFSSIDYRPFWVSLKTSGLALAISFALGLFAAWRVMGTSSRLKGVLDSVFTIPMVLPPTVCGFLLLMLFGQSTAVGRWLMAHGITLVFTWEAAVISAIVVSFPLVYRTALGAFESLDGRMIDAARTLGWSEVRIFSRLMMPLAWPSIAAGTVLAFARAMGEFGCTLFFAGNYAGITQTIPIAIYFEWMGGNTAVALFWVMVVIAFSFLVVWGINAYTARHQGYRDGAHVGVAARGGVRGKMRGHALARSSAGAAADAGGSRAAAITSFDADMVVDDLESTGGDAAAIDLSALRELFEDGAA
ncbi:molybdate ABC transporter permease subunit [Collinsella intestinalis]|uniref:Molybdate ABC transporter permease subunit n=2 Tax=Collinsella intestinalis TaxID=147207 RepID=A0A414G0I5_9ACTN|nr:molybdate ABC transporter permease subunit [Collinsella intestinalis]